jgi:hypothetical protein
VADLESNETTFHCKIALHNTLVILVTENTSYSKEDHLADKKFVEKVEAPVVFFSVYGFL